MVTMTDQQVSQCIVFVTRDASTQAGVVHILKLSYPNCALWYGLTQQQFTVI